MLCLAVVLASCGGADGTVGRVSHPPGLAGTAWRLVAIQDRPVAGPSDVTLEFASDRIAGMGPCNGFGGPYAYEAAEGRLRIGQLISTKRACLDPALGDLEAAYFGALETATTAELDGDGRLVLVGADSRLVFEAAARAVAQ